MVHSCLIFLKCQTISQSGCDILHSYVWYLFLNILASIWRCHFFYFCNFNRYVMMSHLHLYLHVPNWSDLIWMSRYADDTTLMAESEEETPDAPKKPLNESERGEWKSWLKTQHSENKDHGIWSHHFMGNRWGNSGNKSQTLFLGAPKSLQMVTAAMKLKDAYSLEEKLWPT